MKTRPVLPLFFLLATITCTALPAKDPPLPPEPPRGIRSVESARAATLIFRNESQKPAKIYWLDYASNCVLYKELKPGSQYIQATYLTHPWMVVTGPDNHPQGIYYPDPQPRIIVIPEP